MFEVYAQMWLDGPGQRPDRVEKETRERFLEMARTAFERRGEFRLPELTDPPAAERLHEVACPTLVVDGELDFDESHFFAELLERELPAAERRSIRGSAHLPPLDRPEAFVRLRARFLATSAGGR